MNLIDIQSNYTKQHNSLLEVTKKEIELLLNQLVPEIRRKLPQISCVRVKKGSNLPIRVYCDNGCSALNDKDGKLIMIGSDKLEEWILTFRNNTFNFDIHFIDLECEQKLDTLNDTLNYAYLRGINIDLTFV